MIGLFENGPQANHGGALIPLFSYILVEPDHHPSCIINWCINVNLMENLSTNCGVLRNSYIVLITPTELYTHKIIIKIEVLV